MFIIEPKIVKYRKKNNKNFLVEIRISLNQSIYLTWLGSVDYLGDFSGPIQLSMRLVPFVLGNFSFKT